MIRAAAGSLRVMRFGIDVAQQRVEWKELVDRAQFAEEMGFDGAWGFDHFQPMYGEGPGNCFEGMSTLAALSGVTSRLRFGLLVTGVTYRHPSLFTAQAVTIDHASNGRLELALGAAWFEPEHHALSFDFPSMKDRFDRLQDTLEIVTRLMTGEHVSYEGHQFRLQSAQLRPVPVQQPHPPIWIGGNGPRRTLPLVARYADMWHASGTPTSVAPYSERLDRLAEEAGREPKDIGRAASLSLSQSVDDMRRSAAAWRDAGFEYLVCGWPGEGRVRIEEFVERVRPEFAAS